MVLHLKTESNRYTFVDFLSYLFHLQIPGKMQGYNWLNETIDLPPVEIMPPVLKGLLDANGNQYYTVTGEHCILEIDGLLSVCLKVKRKLNCLYGNYIYICNTAYCCIDYDTTDTSKHFRIYETKLHSNTIHFTDLLFKFQSLNSTLLLISSIQFD